MEVAISDWFPTPIWTVKVDNHESLNADLIPKIYALRDSNKSGVYLSNVHGWQSELSIQLMAEFEPLNRQILGALTQIARFLKYHPDSQIIMQAWANINKKGAYNLVHNHPNCHLSGAYYVKTPENSGGIFFDDPRVQACMCLPPSEGKTPYAHNKVRLAPEAGKMYVFPAWLEHGVEPNESDEDRITVGFNAVAKMKRKD